MDEATQNQLVASDPARSTWLTANAGSGKTRVLTDRVARLLLRGAAPERILCLTYTRAAATEMQNRLLARLGEWAMLPHDRLRDELQRLGEGDAADLPQARRLFARAIETPGGLKVQTIHSFCAGVLRRFPIEAGVPIGFAELDDRSAERMRADIVESLAAEDHPVIADLTALHSGHELDDFLAGLSAPDFETPADPDAIWRAFGLEPGFGRADLLARVFLGDEADLLARFAGDIAGTGANNDKVAAALARGDWVAPGLGDLAVLESVFLTGASAKAPFTAKIGSVPTKPLQNGACAPYMDRIDDLMRRIEDARPLHLALTAAEDSLRLHRFAHLFTARYAAAKAAHGWLDFDDQIRMTVRLLNDPAMAQWVLFRLDGGIDHILVDEAQDTSPGQWRVIESLTAEFTSGIGVRDRPRTLFVVGDPKQSIYSFQGADIAVFDAMRARFADAFRAVQAPMQDLTLKHSFRSSPGILRAVDAAFQGDAAQGLGGPPDHRAFHEALSGRIDLWPALAKPGDDDRAPWWQPVDEPAENDEHTQLAQAIAGQIAAMLGQPIYAIRDGAVRPIGPGDILILVQRRSDLFHALIAACKRAGLPIAGADRLKLAAELAVRDIRAVLDYLALPENDLALAAALKSPIFGLDEDALYRLAAGRHGHLAQRLRESPHVEARTILNDLAGQADFMRPYDLMSRLLVRHGGRARLLARLGPEAAEGIDELLSQALAYETAETPSLTGFLVWLSDDASEVRRQSGGADAGLIRVMTVHGAKGLESPIVILPETQKRRAPPPGQTIRAGDLTLWRPVSARQPDIIVDAAAELAARQDEERRRLLYVGLTRAESWLVIAAAGDTGAGTESWHALIAEGLGRAELTPSAFEVPGIGTVRRFSFGEWPDADRLQPPAARDETQGADRPDPAAGFPDHPPPRPERRPAPLAATGLGGAKIIAAPGGDDDAAAAMLRGTRLHLLLEYLPGTPPERRDDLARAVLAGGEGGLPSDSELVDLLDEALAVLDAAGMAGLIAPEGGGTVLAEVPLTLPWGDTVLHGTIDRLIVWPDRVLAVDYKSNVIVPGEPGAVPDGILRQMAAYRQALRAIYPGRSVETAILWTAAQRVMALPDGLLDQAMATLDPGGPRS